MRRWRREFQMVTIPRKKLVPGKSFYFAGVMVLIIGILEGYAYTRAGSVPQNMTATQASLDSRSSKHWVRLTGLQLDCARPVQEIENGKVSRTFYTATDNTKHAVFIVDYEGNCDATAVRTYDGMLESNAGDYIVKQLSAAGVSVPAGDVRHLTVGDTPASTMKAAVFFAVAGAITLAVTWWTR